MNPLPGMIIAAAAVEPAAASDPWLHLGGAILLIALAALLLALEFFVISGGLLIIASFVSCFAGCMLAFAVSPTAGWIVVASTPVAGIGAVRWGLARLAQSRAVPRAEVTEDAGYHHLAERLGISVGSVGELITDAMPTGRARFAGDHGELDVLADGPGLQRGTRVVVLAITGPTVTVAAVSSRTAPITSPS